MIPRSTTVIPPEKRAEIEAQLAAVEKHSHAMCDALRRALDGESEAKRVLDAAAFLVAGAGLQTAFVTLQRVLEQAMEALGR